MLRSPAINLPLGKINHCLPKVSNSIFDNKRQQWFLLLVSSPSPGAAHKLHPTGAAVSMGSTEKTAGQFNLWTAGISEDSLSMKVRCLLDAPSCTCVPQKPWGHHAGKPTKKNWSRQGRLWRKVFAAEEASNKFPLPLPQEIPTGCRQSWGKKHFCVSLTYKKFLTWPHAHGLPVSYVSPLLGQK